MRRCIGTLPAVIMFLLAAGRGYAEPGMNDCNITWDTPSRDHHGTMPLGNGDIGLNAWVTPEGDLVLYISKTDAWDDNGRLVKVGRVRVACDPPLVRPGSDFRQTLDLETASILVRSVLGDQRTELGVRVDARRPVICITQESSSLLAMTASIEPWRTERHPLPSLEVSDLLEDRSKPGKLHEPVYAEPDTVLTNLRDRIGWYHFNRTSVGFDLNLQLQGLSDYPLDDPILHRIFGAILTGTCASRIDDLTLRTQPARTSEINVHVMTLQPATPDAWLEAMEKEIHETEKTSSRRRLAAHKTWWRGFWDRSWIRAENNRPAERKLIRTGTHPVRLGESQHQGDRFRGEIGRASVLGRAMSEEEIARLAAGSRSVLSADPALVGSWVDAEIGLTIQELADMDLSGPLTVEAWVRPGEMGAGGGRLIDKMTPGGSDGLLLDTYPGNSLRFITAAGTLRRENVLATGAWHHVAATVDPAAGELKLYHDGKVVDEEALGEPEGDALVVTRAYTLQRFMDACAGRGQHPIKFNGSIFTVPHGDGPSAADYRRWGPGYWWQNTRLPYLSMCTSGDFDLLQPLFKMYGEDLFELGRFRTEKYLGHEGVYYPECMYFWGAVFTATYGWTPYEEREDKLQESGWHKWEWVCGPELVHMMLDYYDHTLDRSFLEDRLLPVADGVLRFFTEHYPTNEEGVLVMHPSMACETWWDCTNPMPELAGLHAVTARLLALPGEPGSGAQRAFWAELKQRLPELPTREVEGGRALAPAERFEAKRNVENPELYAVFPFRLCSFEKANRDLGLRALEHRWDRGNAGWRQDDLFMTYLGLTEEARENLVGRARNYDQGSRFPAFWGPNYDWIPDQDHGGVLMKAFQTMLIQTVPATSEEAARGGKGTIYLLPAWPDDWDCSFKVHAPGRTVIEGKVKNGRVEDLSVTPPSRRNDIVIVGRQERERWRGMQ